LFLGFSKIFSYFTETKAECSLASQKTEDEVSSNTDIAALKSAPSVDPVSELSLVKPGTLQLCKASVDSETPMEVETVVDESESSDTHNTTNPIKKNEDLKLVNEEQPQLVSMKEEQLEQSALVEVLSCDANKDEPNLVEEQQIQDTTMVEECEKEPNLVSADAEKTTQQTPALEDLKSNLNEEESKPVSDVSEEENTQETVIGEEPKVDEKQIQDTETVEDSNTMPDEEEPELVTDASEKLEQETLPSEELNTKTNEDTLKVVNKTDKEKKLGTKTAEELDFKADEEEVKPIGKVDEEEKQETVTLEELNFTNMLWCFFTDFESWFFRSCCDLLFLFFINFTN